MEIFTLLESLEDILENSKNLPFTNKGMVDKEEIRFFPVNAFVLFSKWTKFSMIRRQCQAVWLILKMKQFHKRRGGIFQNCARVDSMHFTVDSCRRSSGGGASVI